MSLTLASARTLVLNADMLPLSMNPLSAWSWQDAVNAVFKGKATVIDNYSDLEIHSPSITMPVPSVIALTNYIYNKSQVRFTRYNIYLRDKFTCAYCDTRFLPDQLSFDHVIPRSRGGTTTWENIVTSCVRCNQIKNDSELGIVTFPRGHIRAGQRLRLHYQPYAPTHEQFRRQGRLDKDKLHETWIDFVYWDSELEE